MESRFLDGLLAMLLKNKAKVEKFLSTMAKEFRTLEVLHIADDCFVSAVQLRDGDSSSSDSEID